MYCQTYSVIPPRMVLLTVMLILSLSGCIWTLSFFPISIPWMDPPPRGFFTPVPQASLWRTSIKMLTCVSLQCFVRREPERLCLRSLEKHLAASGVPTFTMVTKTKRTHCAFSQYHPLFIPPNLYFRVFISCLIYFTWITVISRHQCFNRHPVFIR